MSKARAKATPVIEQVVKMVEVTEEKLTGYTLTITVEEAQILRGILARLNGDGMANHHIYNALRDAEVGTDEKHVFAICAGRFGVWTKERAADKELEIF